MRKNVFIVLLFVALVACKKENNNAISSGCGNIPRFTGGGLGWFEIKDQYDYFLPTFSANNPDEFFFSRYDRKKQQSTIIRCNIKSPFDFQEVITSDIGISGRITASDKYVVFSRLSDGQLWRINKDGSGLIKITDYNVPMLFPSFSSDGKKIVSNFNGTSVHSGAFIIDEEGTQLDNLYYLDYSSSANYYPTLNINNILALYSPGSNGICILDVTKRQFKTIFTQQFKGGLSDIQSPYWHPNNEDIYFVTNGSIYSININNPVPKKITSNCPLDHYVSVSVSEHGNYAIGQRETSFFNEKDSTVTINNNIFLIDLNTGNERQITK